MVAEDSYQDLLIDNKNQSIIISGESGAGKTEATKIILCYLAKANTDFTSAQDEDMLDQRKYLLGENNIEKQVLDSNPLLEAFGNAKTFKNNNSSRFGKFIQVNFEPSGKIHSANIVQYLLEKSRIVYQQGVERNFHVFYQLMANAEVKQKYDLGPIQNYHYLSQTGVYQVNDVNDGEDFKVTLQCMKNIGFSQSEIDQVLDIVVAILLLGNLEIVTVSNKSKGDMAGVDPDSKPILEQISKLIQLAPEQVQKALTTKIQIIGKDTIETPLTKEEALTCRDGVSKVIYGKLFSWIVKRINESISEKMNAKGGKKLKFIGLLDIFGFEIFQENSFEQLCINYANEKLQQHFNQHMFTLEQEEYQKEQVQWKQIAFVDNQQCIDVIENPKAPSLFKLLDEECMIKGTDNGLLKKQNDMLCSNRSYKRPPKFGSNEFIIAHYAGEVEYSVQGFLEKNRDAVSDIIKETFQKSKSDLLSSLFLKDSNQQAQPPLQGKGTFGQVKTPQGGGLKGNSLSNQFRTQLNELINILKESSPRYIRCIKPNSTFSSQEFDSYDVCKQLRCAGMLEAIRIRKAGYAIRITQEDFAKRYKAILGPKQKKQGPNKQTCEVIFKEVMSIPQFKSALDPQLKRWQIGMTKVFMKEDIRQILEQSMGMAVLGQVKFIQKIWKGFQARKLFRRMRASMKLIKLHLRKYIIRRRWRAVIRGFIKRMRGSLSRIQKMCKWRARQRRVLAEINKRIHIKRKEAEDRKRKEEAERVKRDQEEQVRWEQADKQKRDEFSRFQTQRLQEGQSQSKMFEVSNTPDRKSDISCSSSNINSTLRQSQQFSNEDSAMNNTSYFLKGPPGEDASIISHSQQQLKAQPIDSKARYEYNRNRIEKMMLGDNENAEQMEELERKLNDKDQENQKMKQEIDRLRQDVEERDRRIRDLTIRLEARKQSKLGKEADFPDLSKFDMSFATTTEDRVSSFPRISQSQIGGVMNFHQELEKAIDAKEEQISSLKNQIEVLQAEKQGKDTVNDTLQEENEVLQEKNKKWIQKLEQEIEKNNENVSRLTKQIKDLQERNYKLDFESRQMTAELEKKAFKSQSEELSHLESQLREKNDIVEELGMEKFNLEQIMAREQNQMQNELEEITREYALLEEKYNKQRKEYDHLEGYAIEKDELAKKYEEENVELQERLKIAEESLSQLGVHQTNYLDNLENQHFQSSQQHSKLKEVKQELERVQGLDKVRQGEIDRLKETTKKQKKRVQELENENEVMLDKIHEMKKVKGQLENDLMFKADSNGQSSGNDFEKVKLRQKVEKLQDKLDKKRQDLKHLEKENNFYHQTTTIFLTIKKVIDKEKKFCFMFAQEGDVIKKKQVMDAITMCRDKEKQLDNKLKKLLLATKQQQQDKESR